MFHHLTHYLLITLTLLAMQSIVNAERPYSEWTISELEKRLTTIDSDLEKLASMSLRSGVGAVGYRSRTHDSAKHTETIEINLEKKQTIDEIMLVPCIWRHSKSGFRADGFPEEFNVIAGSAENPEGSVIARYTKKDNILPRIAPLIIACRGVEASWIRIEATVLTPRAWDGKYILQLFEILVFNQQENIALLKPVQSSSPQNFQGGARDKKNLVNGFVPYLMDAAEGEQSLAYVSKTGIGAQPQIIIDLGQPYPISRLHLHATDISDTVPQAVTNDFGMPRKLLVEGANKSDFSDAVRLTGFAMESVYHTAPIVMRNFPETTCQYIRLTALEPFKSSNSTSSRSQIGFAEIELFANGINVAEGAEVLANFDVSSRGRTISALTDGRNLYGTILPIRTWLNQLAQRHALETERPIILSELELHYARQKANLNYLLWLVALLVIAIIIAILIGRMLRMRQVSNIRLRLAADLHDELGANIHTIGLLSDLASESGDDPEELATLHRRIRSETERSGIAVRHCTNMLEADGLYKDLTEDMARASRRIMAKLDHDIEIEGEEHLSRLKQQARVDLYLFYKECLVNISRHSGATKFKTRLIANRDQVLLTISDNGRELDDELDAIPNSLQRRAKLLGATIKAESPENGGTSFNLTLPLRSWGYRKNKKS